MPAGDFYFAINATFRFIHDQWGKEALIDYWTSMAHTVHAPIAKAMRNGGLEEVRRYWADYFAGEPDGDVAVELMEDRVEIVIRRCPSIHWLEKAEREIVPYYCEHCHAIGAAIARQAGLTFELQGGNGSCRQVYASKEKPSQC